MGQVYESVEYQVQEASGWTTMQYGSHSTDQEVRLRLDSMERSYPDRRVRAYAQGEGIIDLR